MADNTAFAEYIRQRRQELQKEQRTLSLREVARRIGVEPSYLSKVERGIEAPPSELKVRALAEVLHEDPDLLLALAGKVSDDLLEIIRKRPQLFGDLLRAAKDLPDQAVLRVVREIRDGEW